MSVLKVFNADEIWQREQGWDAKKKSGRKFEDKEELAFWDKIAPVYTEQFNLYKDAEPLRKKLFELIPPGSSVVDLGCGSGNFAIPLSRQCSKITGVDFSPAMLDQMEHRIKAEKISNIKSICGKFEEVDLPDDADFVIAINALYRICYLRTALGKIYHCGKKGFIIVRTIVRPYLYELYESLNISYRRSNDYMLIPMMLWDMGIEADVKYIPYYKVKEYENLETVENDMLRNVGEFTYLNYSDQLLDLF